MAANYSTMPTQITEAKVKVTVTVYEEKQDSGV
jgi:hypothetical protein